MARSSRKIYLIKPVDDSLERDKKLKKSMKIEVGLEKDKRRKN